MPIIKNLSKIKNKNTYNVLIDDKSYIFDEDTILEYHLFKDKEITNDILDKALESTKISTYYNQALNYAYKYGKNSKEVYYYLVDKGVNNNIAFDIVNKLKDKKIINEEELIESIIYSLIKNYNGKKMIIEKLKNKKFDMELIDKAISNIDYDFYFESLNNCYQKIKNKYNKYDNYIRINKIKQYLYQRGYEYNDINMLEIE